MGVRIRSSRRPALAVAAMLLVPPAVMTAPAVASRPPAAPVLEWGLCGEDFPAAECAVATVPLDYDRPSRGTTQIALARIPAADPDEPDRQRVREPRRSGRLGRRLRAGRLR